MRKIKFRAWLKDNWGVQGSKMIEVLYAYPLMNDPERVYDLEKTKYKDDEFDITLLQYTGLKDKNGVEIYEGDIVHRADGYIGTVEYGKVLHSNTGLAYVGFYLRKDEDNYTHIDGTLEVIGNIFEGLTNEF